MEVTESKIKSILKGQKEEFQDFVVEEMGKQDKRFDAKLKEHKEDFKNYTGMLAEHFVDQVKVIAGGCYQY